MTEAPQQLRPAAVWQDVTARYHGLWARHYIKLREKDCNPVWEMPIGPLALQVMRRDEGWYWRCPYVRRWTALAAGDEREALAVARRALGSLLMRLSFETEDVGGER